MKNRALALPLIQGAVQRVSVSTASLGAPVAALTALAVTLAIQHGHIQPYNFRAYAALANGLLHGHLWETPAVGDTIAWPLGTNRIPVDGWAPVLPLLPVVALFGFAAGNQMELAALYGAAAVYAAWRLCENLNVKPLLLGSVFAIGTDVLYCAVNGSQWHVASIAGVAGTMAALAAVTSPKPRWWLVLAFALFAGESREAFLLALPLYAFMLQGADRKRFVLAAAVWVAVFTVYNCWFWGVPYNAGHQNYWLQRYAVVGMSPAMKAAFPAFGLRYVYQNFYVMFITAPTLVGLNPQGPAVTFDPAAEYPYFGLHTLGCGLVFTTPALLLSLLASKPRKLVIALWLTAAATMIPSLLYLSWGNTTTSATQYGARHAMDFEPFLFTLMLLGVREAGRSPLWGRVLCLWSIGFGAWGLWFWLSFVGISA